MLSYGLIACLLVASVAASALPCQTTVRGQTYNIQAACHANGTSVDWIYKSPYNQTYYINVCNNLVSSNPCGNDSPGYSYDTATGECFRLGLLEAEWWGNSYFDTLGQQGIVVMYDEGDTCADGFSRAKISLVFHCNPNVSVQLTSVVGIGQYCHWVAHFESKYGCPM